MRQTIMTVAGCALAALACAPHAAIAAPGQNSYDGCLANDASQGCGDLPAAPAPPSSTWPAGSGTAAITAALTRALA